MLKVVMIDDRHFDTPGAYEEALVEVREMESELLVTLGDEYAHDFSWHIMSFEKVDAIVVDGELDRVATRQALELACRSAIEEALDGETPLDQRLDNFQNLVDYVVTELGKDEDDAVSAVDNAANAGTYEYVDYSAIGLTDSHMVKVEASLNRLIAEHRLLSV